MIYKLNIYKKFNQIKNQISKKLIKYPTKNKNKFWNN